MTDPDLSGPVPTVQPVWCQPGGPWRSFNRVPGWVRADVLLPFPWHVRGDPVYGVRCVSPWAADGPLSAGQVYHAAGQGRDGFRFLD